MVQLFLYIWMAAIPLILAGCGVGPSMLRADRLTYNDAIQFTERQELLLNIVARHWKMEHWYCSTRVSKSPQVQSAKV
jgi:hypothetical protein